LKKTQISYEAWNHPSLGTNKDVFAFDPLKIPKIAPELMEHRLNNNLNHKPVIQNRRYLGAKTKHGSGSQGHKALGSRIHKGMLIP